MSTYSEYENGALNRAVRSVLAQTYANWELIIVGDCVPYAEKITRLVERLDDRRIIFTNMGTRAGWNSPGTVPKQEGISRATGGLLAFLDADNEYFPQHLEYSVKLFLADSALDLVYGDMVVRLSRNVETRLNPHFVRVEKKKNGFVNSVKKEIFRQFVWKKPNWNDRCAKQLLASNFLDMSEPVFTRAAYKASGGLATEHHAADWMLWKAFIAAGKNNFKHSPHLGLIYYTSTIKQHLCYLGLMLAQKSGIGYTSENFKWIQKSIRKRFEKKYGP